MAIERMKIRAGNWRLHLIIQSFTFLLFPVVGLAFYEITRIIWPSEPRALRDGFLYLCVLPSTVSTSVVLTEVARGITVKVLAGIIALAALQKEGKVRWIGLSNASVEEMQKLQGIARIASLQPPYSLIRRNVETEQLPWCRQANVGVYLSAETGSRVIMD